MTRMSEFLEMAIEQRVRCTFIPISRQIYNGRGYSLGPKAGWDDDKITRFEQWRKRHGVKYDSVVYEFPDEETFIMARLMFE